MIRHERRIYYFLSFLVISIHLQCIYWRVTRGGKGGTFFENWEKCNNLGEKCPDCGYLWIKLFH